MTLRARLVFALLLMALVPTGVLSLFALDQLNQAIQRWYRPGVDRALESALETTKISLTRLEATALGVAQDWSHRVPQNSRNTPGRTPDDRAALAAALSRAGLDFFQIYTRGARGWVLAEQVTPPGVIVIPRSDLSPELPDQLEGPHVLHSKTGVLAALAPGASSTLVAAGFQLTPDFFEQVDRVTQGATHYRRLGVYVGVQRGAAAALVGIVVLALVALAVPLATQLARQISRPLGQLSSAMELVAGGDLEARVEPSGAAELRSLGASFNTMTGRLVTARDQQQRAEREAAWRDVARKLAHEFKNILTPIKLSLQLLECQIEPIDPEQRDPMHRSLEAALREVGSLNRLADQFSQYARLPEPYLEPIDLVEVARAATALEPDARIRLEAEPGGAPVLGDRLLLSRAAHNLLRNAREADASGAIEIRIGADATTSWVEVLDRGAGLPEGGTERLFEPYVSTKKRGSGLGLSLVHDIALQHGGSITLENREGGGARARLAIPRAHSEITA